MRPPTPTLIALFAATVVALPSRGDVATDLQETFIGVAERVSDSVVTIEVRTTHIDGDPLERLSPFDLERDPGGFEPLVEAQGSGVIIDADGHIVTNDHVVRGAVEVSVRLHDGRQLAATIVGEDPDSDLAVLLVETDDLAAARFAPSSEVAVGQWAIALGAPFGLQYSMTVGHVSALSRQGIGSLAVQDFVQTDASINPGNSGGPLVDIQGRVIGINTMILGMGTGIGLAIPADIVRDVAADLICQGRVIRGHAGLHVQDLEEGLAVQLGAPPETRGAVVTRVDEGGPAQEAGLRRGDIVTHVGGEPVARAGALMSAVFAADPGTELPVRWLRGSQAREAVLTVVERAATDDEDRGDARHTTGSTGDDVGFNVDALTEVQKQRLGWPPDAPGLLVRTVRLGSPAQRAGLVPGDVVVEVEGVGVSYPVDLARQVLRAEGDAVLMYVYRSSQDAWSYVVVDKP